MKNGSSELYVIGEQIVDLPHFASFETCIDQLARPAFYSQNLSLLIPSRQNFASLKATLEDLLSKCRHPANIELVLGIDLDDIETIQSIPQLPAEMQRTILIRPRGRGYQELNLLTVRLTTARYYTPTGRSIQRPYSKNGNDDYYDDYRKRVQSGELTNEDKIPVADSLQFSTPKGKIVYGGGGIIPDVFVAVDTTFNLNNFYFRTINDFAFNYVDSKRTELTKKWDIDSFLKDFDTNTHVYNSYFDKYKDLNPSYKTKQSIRKYLKASVANVLFGDVGFYRVIHQDDKMLQKVLELDSKQE